MGKNAKMWLIVGCILMSLSIVTGCEVDESEPSENEQGEVKSDIEQNEQEELGDEEEREEKAEPITTEEVEAALKSGVGADDLVISLDVIDFEIRAVVELAPDDVFPAKETAISRYSSITDELLTLEGWETVTVEFVDVGTVSMDIDKKVTNEFGGEYFLTTEIDRQLSK